MIQKYTYKKLTWIDIESPTTDEVSKLLTDYHLHPLVAEEILNPTLKPKIDFYKDYIYLILRFPVRNKVGNSYTVSEKEVDFIISKDFIITSRYDSVEPLHNFSKMFEVNSILDKSGIGEHAGFIFYYMLKNMYKHMSQELESIKSDLIQAEQRIFVGEEKEMVQVLSRLSRELIDFRQTTRIHKDVLESLSLLDKDFFGKDFSYYISDIQSEYFKTYDLVSSNRELVNDLRTTNDSLLSTKQNETMKVLTLMAFVTFPLSLITEIFSMNTTHSPIIGTTYDFEIILSIMFGVTLLMFTFFKTKRWL